MSTMDPRPTYDERRAFWNAAIAEGDRRHLLVSNLRLLVVGLFALVVWLAFGRAALSPLWLLAAIGLFGVLMAVHARVLNARDRATRARRYFDRGVSRLDDAWSGDGETGARFGEGHAYARDLDLFGHGSLFQLLNTATTEAGEATLADWLRQPAPAAEVLARQDAVTELRQRLDVREGLAVFGAEARVTRTGALARWSAQEAQGLGRPQALLFAASAAVTAVLSVLVFQSVLPLSLLTLWLGLQGLLVYRWRVRITRVLNAVEAAAYDLSALSRLLERIEGLEFRSEKLRLLAARLRRDQQRPSVRLARLRIYLAARDSLHNEFVRPFALLLIVRSQAAVAIDRWHAVERQSLGDWLSVIGELEALCAMATFAFEHPLYPLPRIDTTATHLRADALAHPLLPSAAVANDVLLGESGPQALIVSGSNMSGKSTLLRAVGVNVVLALAGAPVRARLMSLSPLSIGATLRIEDSLQEGQSRFYAEVLRIRDVVAAAERAPLLFLLDEILHGTNSHDRRIGAEAIVKALVAAGAIGLVTTHDLALTALPAQLGARARNVHFEDRIEEGRMSFDYVMREGVVERSNAIALMRAVGLKV